MKKLFKKFLHLIYQPLLPVYAIFHKLFITHFNLLRNYSKETRLLEIGPGKRRISGFETLNIIPGLGIDYVCDASKALPFRTETFDLIYASHILEHIPWYQSKDVLTEWVRLLKPAGWLEIWVPDGLKIAKTFVDAESGNVNLIHQDGWYRFNEKHDPCIWANGRIFSYGDGKGTRGHSNWHLALFSSRYLASLLEDIGLKDIETMHLDEVRGYNHGWINLGIRARKP